MIWDGAAGISGKYVQGDPGKYRLTNCKTLFLVDRKKFLVGDDSQIEKYISYRLELCTIDYREILKCVMDSVISDEFIERMSPVLRKGASKEELREKIYRLLGRQLQPFASEIEKRRKNWKIQ